VFAVGGVGRAPGRRCGDGPRVIARRGRNRHVPFMLTVKAAMVPLRGRSVSLRASSSVTVEARRRRRRASARSGARDRADAIFSGVTDGRSRPTRGLGSIAQPSGTSQPIKSVVRNRSRSKRTFFSSVFSQPKLQRRSIKKTENAPARIFLRKSCAHDRQSTHHPLLRVYIVSVHACDAPPLRAFDDLPPLAHDHQRAHHRPLVDAQTREVLREVPLTRCRADGELLLDLRLH
jgi:hypothetical protein